MVLVTLTFDKEDVTPPVYVAGSFTDWQPVKMDHKQISSSETPRHNYTKQLDLPPGSHQYKYRLGDGDWWMVDESALTALDGEGNLNNAIEISLPEPESILSPPVEETSAVLPRKKVDPNEPLSPTASSTSVASVKSPSARPETTHSPSSTRRLVNQDKHVSSTISDESSAHQKFDGSSDAKKNSNSTKARRPIHHRLFLSCCTPQNSFLLSGLVLVAAAYYVWKD